MGINSDILFPRPHMSRSKEDSFLKNKKFNYWSILLWVVILASVVLFISTGNTDVNRNPISYDYAAFFKVVEEGMSDEIGGENTKIKAV